MCACDASVGSQRALVTLDGSSLVKKARIPCAILVAGLATQGALPLVQILKRIATAKGGERAQELNLEGVSVLVAMTQSQWQLTVEVV
jgi:hypothetical protein